MRVKSLISGDIRFQFKYGFYLVYAFFTAVYVSLFYIFPQSWRGKAASIMILSDPAAIGLFFMGAIVLFEKSERVLNAIAVSPVKTGEYIASKVVSLGIISAAVGLVIAMSAGVENLGAVLAGILLGSAFFTLVGLTVASRITSLNQFLAVTIPVEIIAFVPPLLYLFGYGGKLMLLHPGCEIISLISAEPEFMVLKTVLLCAWIAAAYFMTLRSVGRMFEE